MTIQEIETLPATFALDLWTSYLEVSKEGQ